MRNILKNNRMSRKKPVVLQKRLLDKSLALKTENARLTAENANLKESLDSANHLLGWYKRHVFGQRSEKFVSEEFKVDDLFGANPEDDVIEVNEKTIAAHTRKSTNKKSTKLSFADRVPVEEVIIDLPEEERTCPVTGEALEQIGEDRKEELFITPAKVKRVITIRPKYSKLVKIETGYQTEIIQAKAEPTLVRGSKFHFSFLVHLCVQKFVFHMPLNRIIEDMNNKGVTVSSQVLSSLIINISEKLTPLFELMEKELFKQKYLFFDDTGAKMLDKGSKKAKKTHVWVHVGGDPDKPKYVIYKHTEKRLIDTPAEMLAGFQGVITADALAGHVKLNDDPDSGILWNGCWDHARRNFEPYVKSSKTAAFMMEAIRELSMNERECWKTCHKGRLDIRREIQTPLVDEMFAEMNRVKDAGTLTPKNKVLKAINYMVGREEVFKRFLTDSKLRIENNNAEHGARKLVIGRNAWMFFGSKRGADAGCKILSFAQSCRNMEIMPEDYFSDIFQKLAIIDTTDQKQLRELLPHIWKENTSK